MKSSFKDRPHYRNYSDLAQFEPLNTPLWVFDVERHAMWWGNSSALIFWQAKSLEALLARDFSSDSEVVRTRLRQLVDGPTGPGRIQETWTLYPAGQPTTVIADLQPVLIEEGRHAILLEASRALDLKEDPEALRILEAARSSALMVSSFSLSGRLLAQNPASHACYGQPEPKAGQSDLTNRFNDAETTAAIVAAIEREGHFEAELPVSTVGGPRIHRVLARKGRDPVTGEFITVLNEEDMTEQAELRRNLRQLNDELEARVAERTEHLQALTESLAREIEERRSAEDRLRQAQKMEAIGQLTGGIAHDFNNLLAVILGNAELLEAKVDGHDSLLSPILRAAERGSELTQRLLAFSRQQSLHPQPVDLGQLIKDMSDLLRRTLGATIEIEVVSTADLGTALADPGQMENALLNLALNARDAMSGRGRLTIECRNAQLDETYVAEYADATPGDYVLLAITDSGSGMSAEVQAHAFEPFFTTKQVGQGSGLGLSMVYGFVKQSGGHVSLYSEEGCGTTVRVYLPRADQGVRQGKAAAEAPLPRGAGEVILVIEDDEDVRALVVKQIEDLGFRTIEAGDARTAHRILSDGTAIDLVLSDVVLPGGTSGPEFANTARTLWPDLDFIFMSGYPKEAIDRNGFLGSGSVLLSKPFQKRQLAEALRDALNRNGAAPP